MPYSNPQADNILTERKFNEFCSVLGVKELCCLDPDRKKIEKAFRKSALKCHPDKGGDPVVFKKLNDAYLKLIGHIQKVTDCRVTDIFLIKLNCYKNDKIKSTEKVTFF